MPECTDSATRSRVPFISLPSPSSCWRVYFNGKQRISSSPLPFVFFRLYEEINVDEIDVIFQDSRNSAFMSLLCQKCKEEQCVIQAELLWGWLRMKGEKNSTVATQNHQKNLHLPSAVPPSSREQHSINSRANSRDFNASARVEREKHINISSFGNIGGNNNTSENGWVHVNPPQ